MPLRTACLLVVLLAAPARADDEVIPGHTVDGNTEGLIIGGAVVTTLGLMAIPVDQQRGLWSRELFDDIDDAARGNFSRRAGHLSDAMVGLSVAAPVIYLTGSTIDDADGDRLLLYGQALAINLAVNAVAKYTVQRPRPYLYSKDPGAKHRARDKGGDSRLSFYSGHAATAFCAAASGAYLLGTTTESPTARTLGWGIGFGVAAATANLRVRAGEHFYSDVAIGAVIGTAIGFAVPALHADDAPLSPNFEQVAIGGVGVLAGILASQLIPLENNGQEVTDGASTSFLHNVQITPLALADGAGIGIGGSM